MTESNTALPGAEGTTPGITDTGFDATPEPSALNPRTRTVYVVPFVRRLIVNEFAPAVRQGPAPLS